MVQGLVKGVTISSRTKEILQDITISKTMGIPERRDLRDEDIAFSDSAHLDALATKKRGSVTGEPPVRSEPTISPKGDILCGVAPPPKDNKAIGRTSKTKTNALPPRKETQSGTRVTPSDGLTKNCLKVAVSGEVLKIKRSSGDESEDLEEPLRRSKRVQCDVSLEVDSAPKNFVVERRHAKRETVPPCTLSRQTSNFECEGLDTLAWVSMPLSMGVDDYRGEKMPLPSRTTNTTVTTVIAGTTKSGGGVTKLKLPKKGKGRGNSGAAQMDTVRVANEKRREAARITSAPVRAPMVPRDKIGDLLAASKEEWADQSDEEYAAGKEPEGVMVAFSAENQRAMARDTAKMLVQNETVEEAVSKMVTWEVEFATNTRLLQYWVEGNGTPNPATFHPELERMLLAREEVLRDFERVHLSLAQAESDDRLSRLQPPAPPVEPSMPGLYYLRTFEDAVELPWSWDCDGGDDFRRKWDSAFLSAPFQELLMGCLWWWTAKKVSYTNKDPGVLKIAS